MNNSHGISEEITYHDVKVFQLEEHNVGTGKLIWEGKAPVRSDGYFAVEFKDRCYKRAKIVDRTIRVEVKDGRYPLHFYRNEIAGWTHVLPGLKGSAIRHGYVFFDYRRNKRRGRFIGYLNEGHGFYFTKDIYQNIIFKGKHPKLNSNAEAVNWMISNAIGWKTY